jgi:lambda repressor-like predicted transcriptional regulator
MKITPEQARVAAQVLFPEDYAADRVNAILKTIDWLREVDEEPEQIALRPVRTVPLKSDVRKGDSKAVMARLAAHMKKEGISMNRLAANLGISGASLRQWLLGQYVPRPESLQRIQAYLDNLPK